MTNPAPLEVILDLERAARIGLPEAVLCEPKSTAHLISILETLRDTKRRMLFTRLSQAAFDALPIRWKKALDFDVESNTAYYGTLSSAKVERNISRLPQVAIVCAGTSDSRVVKECHRTLKFSNVSATCTWWTYSKRHHCRSDIHRVRSSCRRSQRIALNVGFLCAGHHGGEH
jgi:NCAIR mutase (PurE)-related protein